jgi:UDP:flavonoid glycosyltransferase YjiC (YdhE family)
MKILVATIGSRGDVQPYINLSQGLRDAGHDVVLATNPTLCALVESHGVKSAPVGTAVDMGEVGERLLAQSFNNMWIGMIRVMQLGAQLVEEAYPDVLKLTKNVDLVVTSDTTSGIAEAEKLGVPWLSVTLQPARLPADQASPSLLGQLIGKLMVLPTNSFRKRVGAPAVRDISSMMSERMILLPVNCQVAPPQPGWPKQVRQTGYWFARPLTQWSPPSDLLEFLAAGARPIAVSLGVMGLSGKQSRQSAEIILDAIKHVGVRAVVQGWEPSLIPTHLAGSVYCAGSLPHSWLFDQVKLVIHHGGFGTTAAALRAGISSLVVPHIIDQFYWGQRVFELGVGPQYMSRGHLKTEPLQQALIRALTDSPMQAKAAALGKVIRAEADGVTTAVKLIERQFG